MPKKGYRPTQKHRENLSTAATGRKMSDETRNKISLALVHTSAKEHTKLLMRKREAVKRKLYLILLQHLEIEHSYFDRKICKGYSMWRICPECGKSVEDMEYSPEKLKKAVPKQSSKLLPPEKEINLFTGAIEEEMKLGTKEVI